MLTAKQFGPNSAAQQQLSMKDPPMEVSRRSFLKRGLLLGGGAASGLVGTAHAARVGGKKSPYKLTSVTETTNICCYCSGGCGTICSTRNGELINLEGDPDHPVNLGRCHVGPS